MKRKKSKFTLQSEPVIKTASQLAKERGLDLTILEKEAEEYGFGVTVSGVVNIDEAKYDSFVNTQIMDSEIGKEKKITRKSLSEVNKSGVLSANIARLTEQLEQDKTDREWQNEQIEKTTGEISRKQAQVKLKRLDEKIERKKTLIETAYNRLNHLLDAELGEQEKTE